MLDITEGAGGKRGGYLQATTGKKSFPEACHKLGIAVPRSQDVRHKALRLARDSTVSGIYGNTKEADLDGSRG